MSLGKADRLIEIDCYKLQELAKNKLTLSAEHIIVNIKSRCSYLGATAGTQKNSACIEQWFSTCVL